MIGGAWGLIFGCAGRCWVGGVTSRFGGDVFEDDGFVVDVCDVGVVGLDVFDVGL